MTIIYGINEKYNGTIELVSVEVKETPKLYRIVEGQSRSAFGYASQLHKDDKRVSLSAKEAIDKYIKEKQQQIERLQDKIDIAANELAQAEILKLKNENSN